MWFLRILNRSVWSSQKNNHMSRLTQFFSCSIHFHSNASVLRKKKDPCTFTLSLNVLLCAYLHYSVSIYRPHGACMIFKMGSLCKKVKWGGEKIKTVQIARLNWVLLTPCWRQLIVQKQQQESETEVSVGKFQPMTVINEIY